MGQPERSASSTRRTPSTPTKPDSVGKPPRRAMRNSLSQRLSRLARIADLSLGRTFRAGLLGVAIAWRLANSWHRALNSRAMSNDPQTRMDELDARADRSGYLALGGISFFFDTFRTLCSYSYSSSRLEFRVCSCWIVGSCGVLVAFRSAASCGWGAFLQDTFWDSQNQSFRYRKGRNALVRNKQGQISSPNRLSPCGEDAEGNPCEYQGLLPGRPGAAF